VSSAPPYELVAVFEPDRQRCLDAVLAVLRAPMRPSVRLDGEMGASTPPAASSAAGRGRSTGKKKAAVSSH